MQGRERGDCEEMTTIINEEYKYDVAFSFVVDDEELAKQLNVQIKNRMKTFIYFEHQKKLAGKDGEEEFNRVFGTEARVVVILYRKIWGTTSWTRIEETAIKNRGYDEGYDFVILIPLDKPSTSPRWLPKTRMWIGLERWGIDAAAAVIEARVQEHGGAPREETVEEYAERINQETAKKQKQKDFLESSEGVKKAEYEFKNIYQEVKHLTDTISNGDGQIKFSVKDFYVREIKIYTNNHFSVYYLWEYAYSNTLDKSVLYMCLLKEPTRFEDNEQPKKLKEEKFVFEIGDSGECGWRAKNGNKRFYSSKKLAGYGVKKLVDTFK
jgi:hypothetical protein